MSDRPPRRTAAPPRMAALLRALLLVPLLAGPVLAAAAGADPDPLFADQSVVELELEAPWTRIVRDRSPEPEEHPARLGWTTADGDVGALKIEVRARGRSRRHPDVCAFPPLRLDIPRSRAAGTLFAEQDKLKLVTHCARLGSNDESSAEFVALEYLAYRFLNTLTDRSFRVRPARISYVLEDGERAMHPGFVIEADDRMAVRLGLTQSEAPTVAGSAMDPDHRTLAEVFQYLIGNTDFSFHGSADGEACCHNAVHLVDAGGVHYPVPYDFDRAGLLNKPGVQPARDLGIRRVIDRRFIGPCREPEDLERVLDAFRDARPALEALLAELPGLRERRRRLTERFLASFWRTLDEPRRVRREFLEQCGR